MSEKDSLILEKTGWNKLYVPLEPQSKYVVVGNESQVLTVSLGNGESVESEPGTMMFFTNGIKPSVNCVGCCGRMCSGECCYDVSYTNTGEAGLANSFISLTPNYPTAKVVPIDMSDPEVNGELLCQQGAYMAKYGEVEVDVNFDFNCARCCCAGTGFAQQKLSGSGTVFLASPGTIVQKVLGEGEVIQIDTNCILAWAKSVTIELRTAGGLLGMFGGGEGIFNTTMTGPGLVIVRSMDEEMFRNALADNKMWRR